MFKIACATLAAFVLCGAAEAKHDIAGSPGRDMNAGPSIENACLKIVFGDEGDGFGIKTIENRMVAGEPFGNPTEAKDPRWQILEGSPASPATVLKTLGETSADFWELQFREKDALGALSKAVFIGNRSACRAKSWKKTATGAEFIWNGVKLPDGEADVKATVAFAPDGTSRWNLTCSANSSKYVKFDTRFPIVRRVVKDCEADWLKPSFDFGALLVKKAPHDKRPAPDRYRIFSTGCLAYAPMMTAFFKAEAGLYYGVHDPRGITKSLVVTPERDLAFWSPASDQSFEVTIAALKGDWWQAAYLYKRWALTAPWCAKGRIVDRTDYPKRICEIPLWLNMHGDAAATSNALQLAKDVFPDISTGIHWHRWQAVPWEIGHYPEYFPTVPKAKETIAYLRSIGQEPMVYTLPRLYSETLLSWHYAKTDALYGPHGKYYVEKYGAFDPPPLVPMCMAQPTYQDVCVDYARRILDLGGRSIFLDQFASCAAHACYATNHVHKPGGGDWFYRGQHEISRRIHDDYAKVGAFTTTEGANDQFIDVIDGYLTVTRRRPEDVPFWHAVYNGYTTYFCTPENEADDEDSFWAQQARDVMWGHTMGWFHPDILKRADKVALLRKLIDFRQANLDVLAYGDLVGEIKLIGPVPKQPVTWLGRVSFPDWGNPNAKLSPPTTGELPGVLAYEWKSGLTGQRVLLFANLTAKEQPVTYEIDGNRTILVLAPRSFKRL